MAVVKHGSCVGFKASNISETRSQGLIKPQRPEGQESQRALRGLTSQNAQNKINKGETGVMRLLCDSEDTQPVLGRATNQQNC